MERYRYRLVLCGFLFSHLSFFLSSVSDMFIGLDAVLSVAGGGDYLEAGNRLSRDCFD